MQTNCFISQHFVYVGNIFFCKLTLAAYMQINNQIINVSHGRWLYADLQAITSAFSFKEARIRESLDRRMVLTNQMCVR